MTKAKNKEEFKERWAKYCKCFDDNDVNSINSQITRMLWNYAIWNLINGSMQYVEKDSDGAALANGALYRSINRWFFETQKMAIRRLIDESGIDGERGVNSIMSVINDIKENAEYLTRENIFELRNLQYDYEPLTELDYEPSDDLHQLIDILSKTSEEKREKSDTIDVNFLTQLKNDLSEQCEQFKIFVDKYCAHAATEESRNKVNADGLKVTVKEYKKAHELMCKYANFIEDLLRDKSNKFLPTPPPDLFLYWDKPIFQGDDPKRLKEIWNKYEDEARQWHSISFDELKKKMENVISNE